MKISKAVKLHKNGTLLKKSWTKYWIVQEEFTWKIDNCDDTGEYISVPKWFKTDFWSIPMIFHIFFSPTKYLSYILHDYWYSKGILHHKNTTKTTSMTRKQVDRQLLLCLKYEWMSFIGRWLIYISVRVFWRLFFRR